MAKARKDYICTHDLTIKGKVVKAGDIITTGLSKETIKQYVDGGILSEAVVKEVEATEE